MFNTGQMLLVLGAIVLFSTLLPSLNETILYSDKNQYAARSEVAATALAQNILTEAATRRYDENCVTGDPQNPLQLTPVAGLGPDLGEIYPYFDDVDDYDGLFLVDSTSLPSVRLEISTQVDYVSTINPSQVVGGQTWLKRLRIYITGPYMANPATGDTVQIRLERLYTYF